MCHYLPFDIPYVSPTGVALLGISEEWGERGEWSSSGTANSDGKSALTTPVINALMISHA